MMNIAVRTSDDECLNKKNIVLKVIVLTIKN